MSERVGGEEKKSRRGEEWVTPLDAKLHPFILAGRFEWKNQPNIFLAHASLSCGRKYMEIYRATTVISQKRKEEWFHAEIRLGEEYRHDVPNLIPLTLTYRDKYLSNSGNKEGNDPLVMIQISISETEFKRDLERLWLRRDIDLATKSTWIDCFIWDNVGVEVVLLWWEVTGRD